MSNMSAVATGLPSYLEYLQDANDCILNWARNNTPRWSSDRIKPWNENQLLEVMPFVSSHYWSDRHSINVYAVVGTAHPDYIGLSWLEFLEHGKRMPVNRNLLKRNPAYYHQTAVKHPSMLYVSLDGKQWYVNGDGNHRTCLARFHFERLNQQGHPSQTMVHGVTVDDYRVDWEFHRLFTDLKEALRQRNAGDVQATRICVARDDGPAWKLDHFSTTLLFAPRKGDLVTLNKDQARALLNSLLPGRGIRRWLGL